MDFSVSLVLQIIALVLFAIAAISVSTGRLNAVAAGLFCWLLSTLL
jgi:hypothetical protein